MQRFLICIGAGILALALFAAEGDRAPAVNTAVSDIHRVVLVRLRNGTDMLDGLKEAVAREKIRNAVFMSAFGSVTSYHIHVVGNTVFPPKDVFSQQNGPFDLVGVGGLVIGGRIHCHITMSTLDKAIGGHLEPGTKVFTFANITIGILNDSLNMERFDDYKWH
jgi:predicted DNA-binding protein with PD1-like motif